MLSIGVVLVVIGQFVAATSLPFGRGLPEGDDIEALCSGKAVDLVSFTQVTSLVAQLEGSSCSEHTKDAIRDLLVLFETDREDVCTMKKVQHIMDYYSVYIDTSDGARPVERIPKTLEQFAIAYALQISSHCKMNMMRVLLEKGVNPLNTLDFKELEEWTKDGGAVGNLLATIAKKGEVVLPGDLVSVMPDKSLINRLSVQTPAGPRVSRAKEVCSKRFEPIYKPVVEPVAALSRAGFDLPDVLLKIHRPEHIEVLYEGMSRWSRVVFLCETLELVETNQGPQEGSADLLPGPEPVYYEPEPSGGIGELIMSSYDGKLRHILKSFDTSKNSSERIRSKLLRRSWSLLKARFKRGEYKAMFKLAMDKMQSKKADGPGGKVGDREMEWISREMCDAFEPKSVPKSGAMARALKPIKQYAQSLIALMAIFDIVNANPSSITFKEIDDIRKEISEQPLHKKN